MTDKTKLKNAIRYLPTEKTDPPVRFLVTASVREKGLVTLRTREYVIYASDKTGAIGTFRSFARDTYAEARVLSTRKDTSSPFAARPYEA